MNFAASIKLQGGASISHRAIFSSQMQCVLGTAELVLITRGMGEQYSVHMKATYACCVQRRERSERKDACPDLLIFSIWISNPLGADAMD